MTQTSVRYDTQNQQAQVEIPLNPHWQEVFNKYDLDKDGKISLAELRTMILSESYERDIPDYTVRKIMQKADHDESGFLDMSEFEEMYWMYIFDKYDDNKDERICLQELQTLLRKRGDMEIPRNVVRKLLQSKDVNEDGLLNFNEFYELVHSKEFRSLMGQMVNTYIRSTVVPRKHDEPDALGDYEDEYSCWPPSICMILISVLEITTFLFDVIVSGTHDANGPAANIFIYNPHKRQEVWRWLTYMFVHVGHMHLVVNLLVQILLGVPLEMVHKWWRVIIIYFAGVLAGSLGTSISDPKVYLAGASGGVYALITAHVASIIMNWSEMRFALLQLVVFFILTGSDIGTAIYNRYVLNTNTAVATKEFKHLMGNMIDKYVRSVIVPRKTYEMYDGMYDEEYSCNPPTIFMPLITLLEIFTYIYDSYTTDILGKPGPASPSLWLKYDPHKRQEIWRFVSYMFVHDGIDHIAGNLLVQVLLGIPLEMVHKWWRVLLIYFAGVLAGSLGTSVTDPNICLVGASGGVYALVTAHIATILMNWSEMRFALLELVVFFIWIGCDVTTAIIRRYQPIAGDKIAYAAHLSGALAGLLVGINILRNIRVKKWEKVAWWVAIVVYCCLMLGAIIWNTFI